MTIIKNIFCKILTGDLYPHLKYVNLSLLFVNKLFQLMGINRGFKLIVHFTSTLGNFDKIKFSLDKNTVTSFCTSGNCYIQAINGIELGENVLFASGIKIISANHNAKNNSTWDVVKPVKIGDNVWIGTNAVILPGVELAASCIVGAGAIVTKSFLIPGTIIAGNPAKVISNKFDKIYS